MRKMIWSAKALFLSILVFNSSDFNLEAANNTKDIYWYEGGKTLSWNLEEGKQVYKLNEAFFKYNSTAKTDFKFHKIANNLIELEANIGHAFLKANLDSGWIVPVQTITAKNLNPNAPFANKKIYLDDILLIQLDGNIELKTEISRLESKYNIEVISKNRNLNNTLLFRNKNKNTLANSALLSAKIYEQESNVVKEVQPNRMNIFEPMGTVNDVDLDKAWFLNKNGSNMSCGSVETEAKGDAEITQAWANGATGKNTKVAVIDFYGFDYNHPDMQGQMLAGWDCINNKSYDAENFYFSNSEQAHGMAVAGVIVAKGDNSLGSAGVAYDSKVIPLLIDGSEASVVLALQKAISDGFDADVINCSFGSYFASPAIKNEINNVTKFGRNNKGTVVVASHGNDYYDDVEYPQYPSSYEEVISVGASTPDDKSKKPGDGWDVSGTWGTNYGDNLHLAAPGVCIYTTDISGDNGYGSTDYISFHKTSAAAPIVSGVVALILGEESALTYSEVLDRLFSTADKVNAGANAAAYDYTYSNTYEGRSRETGYGRVNALKAIGGEAIVGIENDQISESNSVSVKMNTLVHEILKVEIKSPSLEKDFSAKIMDLSGRIVYNEAIKQLGDLQIDTQNWATGMYLVQILDKENKVLENQKVIKSNR